MNYIFPMFRGVGLLILYLWGIAWNVYGFTKFRINYRLILEYGSHYSTHFQVMKRAGFFTLVFAVMLLVYCIMVSSNSNDKYKSTYLAEYTPFVVWVLYFAYIFFPNR
jgi:Kef-type K+ transport system membrane component KefB